MLKTRFSSFWYLYRLKGWQKTSLHAPPRAVYLFHCLPAGVMNYVLDTILASCLCVMVSRMPLSDLLCVFVMFFRVFVALGYYSPHSLVLPCHGVRGTQCRGTPTSLDSDSYSCCYQAPSHLVLSSHRQDFLLPLGGDYEEPS